MEPMLGSGFSSFFQCDQCSYVALSTAKEHARYKSLGSNLYGGVYGLYYLLWQDPPFNINLGVGDLTAER